MRERECVCVLTWPVRKCTYPPRPQPAEMWARTPISRGCVACGRSDAVVPRWSPLYSSLPSIVRAARLVSRAPYREGILPPPSSVCLRLAAMPNPRPNWAGAEGWPQASSLSHPVPRGHRPPPPSLRVTGHLPLVSLTTGACVGRLCRRRGGPLARGLLPLVVSLCVLGGVRGSARLAQLGLKINRRSAAWRMWQMTGRSRMQAEKKNSGQSFWHFLFVREFSKQNGTSNQVGAPLAAKWSRFGECPSSPNLPWACEISGLGNMRAPRDVFGTRPDHPLRPVLRTRRPGPTYRLASAGRPPAAPTSPTCH